MLDLDHLPLRLQGDDYFLKAGFVMFTHSDHPSVQQLFSVFVRPDGSIKPSPYLESICSGLQMLIEEVKKCDQMHLHLYFAPTTSNFLKVIVILSELSPTGNFEGLDSLNSSMWDYLIPIRPENVQRLFVETSKGYAINPKMITQKMLANRGFEVAKSELQYLVTIMDKMQNTLQSIPQMPKWTGDHLLGFDYYNYPIYYQLPRSMVCYAEENFLPQLINQSFITDAVILSKRPTIWEDMGVPVLRMDEVGIDFVRLYLTHPGVVLKTMKALQYLLDTNYRDWMYLAETFEEINTHPETKKLVEYPIPRPRNWWSILSEIYVKVRYGRN
jgi:hypothetical protein